MIQSNQNEMKLNWKKLIVSRNLEASLFVCNALCLSIILNCYCCLIGIFRTYRTRFCCSASWISDTMATPSAFVALALLLRLLLLLLLLLDRLSISLLLLFGDGTCWWWLCCVCCSWCTLLWLFCWWLLFVTWIFVWT